ncbi:MAG: ribulose-phosphate 3-epimerase [archaeon]
MKLVIPTIFAKTKKEFNDRLARLSPISKNLQIDFMDGKFVKAKSISLKDIPDLKKFKNNFEAHLMCLHPEKYLSQLKKKGFKKVIFHIETTIHPEELIQKIKNLKMKPMVAINPKTPIEKLPKKVPVLFMGVNPGEESQSFIPTLYKKIKSFRQKNKRIAIQVDGGVSPRNAKRLAESGVDAINSGSYISEAENPIRSLEELKRLFKCN